MTRTRVLCTARMANGYDCRTPGRVWVEYQGRRAAMLGYQPRCGLHARAYRTSWPLLTADPIADRAIAEGVFS